MTLDIDILSPEYVRAERIKLALSERTLAPKAFHPVEIAVSYAATMPEGVTPPLLLTVQAPSTSGYVERVYRDFAPERILFKPLEGGRHLVLLRELHHNLWLGRLTIDVDGDRL